MSNPTSAQVALQRRLDQCADSEAISREELAWKEKDQRLALQESFERTVNLQLDKERTRKSHEMEEYELAQKTLARRVRVLSTQEQKKRLLLMESEQLELEGILRGLERDIRQDVFDVVAEIALRIKYFNKTMDVIQRNEQSERRETENSERYERLVMKSKMDSVATDLILAERLLKLRQATEAKYVKRRQSMRRQNSTAPAASSGTTGATTAGEGGDNNNSASSKDPDAEPTESNKQQDSQTKDADESNDAAASPPPPPPQELKEETTAEETTEGREEKSPKESPEDGNQNERREDSPDGQRAADSGSRNGSSSRSRSPSDEPDSPKSPRSPPASPRSAVSGQKLSGTVKPKGVASRVNRTHSPAFYERALVKLEERETTKRDALQDNENNQVEQIFGFLDFITERQIEEDRVVGEILQQSREAFHGRQRDAMLKKETSARDSVLRDEKAAWKTVERRAFRERVAFVRREGDDLHQQHIHERKISERRHRIFVAQYRVEAQRQQQGEPPKDESIYPAIVAMTPVPTHVMAQQNSDLGTSADSRQRGFLSHEEKRSLIAHRIASSNEAAQRKVIEKEERLERHAAMKSFKAPSSYVEREAGARTRRAQMAESQEQRTVARMRYEEDRNGVAKCLRDVRQIERTLAEVQRTENAARVEIAVEVQQFQKQAESMKQALHRLQLHTTHLLRTEETRREDIVGAEGRLRDTILETARIHKPHPPKKPPQPLPVPPPTFRYQLPAKSRRPDPKRPEYDMSRYQRKHTTVNGIVSIRAMIIQQSGPAFAGTLSSNEADAKGAPPKKSGGESQVQPAARESQSRDSGAGGGEQGAGGQGSRNSSSQAPRKPSSAAERKTTPASSAERKATPASSGRGSSRGAAGKASRKELRKEQEAKKHEKKQESSINSDKVFDDSGSEKNSRASSSVRNEQQSSVVSAERSRADSARSSRSSSRSSRRSYDSENLSPIHSPSADHQESSPTKEESSTSHSDPPAADSSANTSEAAPAGQQQPTEEVNGSASSTYAGSSAEYKKEDSSAPPAEGSPARQDTSTVQTASSSKYEDDFEN